MKHACPHCGMAILGKDMDYHIKMCKQQSFECNTCGNEKKAESKGGDDSKMAKIEFKP